MPKNVEGVPLIAKFVCVCVWGGGWPWFSDMWKNCHASALCRGMTLVKP